MDQKEKNLNILISKIEKQFGLTIGHPIPLRDSEMHLPVLSGNGTVLFYLYVYPEGDVWKLAGHSAVLPGKIDLLLRKSQR